MIAGVVVGRRYPPDPLQPLEQAGAQGSKGKNSGLISNAGPIRSTHLIAGPALVPHGADDQAGRTRAASLASSPRPRLTPRRLLTEAQHRPDAFAPVPHSQSRQVPTDNLNLAVQLHFARAAARGPQLGFETSPFPPSSAATGVLERAGCPRICLPARSANSSDFLSTVALWVFRGDGLPFHLLGRVLTVAAGRWSADTGLLRTRLASPEPATGEGATSFPGNACGWRHMWLLFGAEICFPRLNLTRFLYLLGCRVSQREAGIPVLKGKSAYLYSFGTGELPNASRGQHAPVLMGWCLFCFGWLPPTPLPEATPATSEWNLIGQYLTWQFLLNRFPLCNRS